MAVPRYTWSRQREGRRAGKKHTLKKDGAVVAVVSFSDDQRAWYWFMMGRIKSGPYNSLADRKTFADADAAKAAARMYVEDLGDRL